MRVSRVIARLASKPVAFPVAGGEGGRPGRPGERQRRGVAVDRTEAVVAAYHHWGTDALTRPRVSKTLGVSRALGYHDTHRSVLEHSGETKEPTPRSPGRRAANCSIP